jgi:hypothetical protein
MIDALERFGDFHRRHLRLPLEKKVRRQRSRNAAAFDPRWLSIKEL